MKHEFLLFLLLSISGYITSSQVATELTDAAIEKGMLENTLKCHAKLQTPIEDYSKSPLTTSMKFMLGEVAMYNADRWLETNMVPPVVIRKETAHDDEEDKDVEILSLCSYWVERSDIEVKSTDELKKLVTDTEWSQMNILYFLFGQYDRNLDGQIRSKETGKLYLTDNEAIANVNQFVVGYSPDKNISCPWAPARINTELSTEGEPENFLDVINSKQDPKKIHEAFDKYVDIWTKRDIDNNCCRMWKQRLWRQFYLMAKYICAPFSETISLKLFNKISELDADTLASFWPKFPIETTQENLADYNNLIEKFVENTLKRKQMIIEYFQAHPKNII